MIRDMYISGVNYESMVDGEGIRATIYISGCKWGCADCHNPKTHSFTYGERVTNSFIDEINSEMLKRPFLSGITLSGGDVMFSADKALNFIDKLNIPNDNIWIYSGFKWEEIINNPQNDKMELLKKCNVLVDGLFDKSLKDNTLKFRGSSNQRIIDIQKSLNQNKVILY